jgi:hypothetical protein
MKISYLAVLALAALPVALDAQQPNPGQQANPITTALRNRTLALRRNLAQAFDSIPADKFSYKPTPAQQSIGFIAQHLAGDNYFFCSDFGAMKPTRSEKDTNTPDSVKATWPKDTLVAKLKESITFCENAMGQLDDAKLSETFQVTARGTTQSVPRFNRVLGHALDLADHYSQLANYMRLNGILPPTALPRPQRGGGGR